LFVCVQNAGRSQMAEALFNKMAPKGWTAVSAGTVPAVRVNPAVTQVLKEIGIDISHAKPKAISNEMISCWVYRHGLQFGLH